MNIEIGSVDKLGSCHFCDRGKLSSGGYNLVYPYKQVYFIDGHRVRVSICEDCVNELNIKIDKIDTKRVADKLTEGGE